MSLRRGIPSLTALQAFEAAARHQSFAKAADELHQTHGAISKRVNELEATLGVALFDRINQRLVLTAAGAEYAHRVRIHLEQIRQDTRQLIAHHEHASLRVAVGVTLAVQWLMPRLPRFYERHPGIQVRLIGRDQVTYFDDLNFDLAIHFDHAPFSGLASRVLLADDEIWMVASPALMQRSGGEDVHPLPWIHTRDLPAAWSAWNESSPGRDERVHRDAGDQHLNYIVMAISAAVAGLGVALLPRMMIARELAEGRLVRIGDYAAVNPLKAYLMFPEHKRAWPPLAAFCAWMEEEMTLYRRTRAAAP